MKLRNKKTGEIDDFLFEMLDPYQVQVAQESLRAQNLLNFANSEEEEECGN